MRTVIDINFLENNFSNIPTELSLTKDILKASIEHCYYTLDMIDCYLVKQSNTRLSELIELANLSSIVGNLLGAGFAISSNGKYYRNRPHTYPDLISSNPVLPGIEIKTALGRNAPKGHQPKEGYYLTYRYCLTNEEGKLISDRDFKSGTTVTIWEVKFGYLTETDFSCSNTEGDSGKTAVIRSASLDQMTLLYYCPSASPYRSSNV